MHRMTHLYSLFIMAKFADNYYNLPTVNQFKETRWSGNKLRLCVHSSTNEV